MNDSTVFKVAKHLFCFILCFRQDFQAFFVTVSYVLFYFTGAFILLSMSGRSVKMWMEGECTGDEQSW